LDEIERRICTKVKEPLLTEAVRQIVDDFHVETGVKKMLTENAAEVAKTPGHKDALSHLNPLQQYCGSPKKQRPGKGRLGPKSFYRFSIAKIDTIAREAKACQCMILKYELFKSRRSATQA